MDWKEPDITATHAEHDPDGEFLPPVDFDEDELLLADPGQDTSAADAALKFVDTD